MANKIIEIDSLFAIFLRFSNRFSEYTSYRFRIRKNVRLLKGYSREISVNSLGKLSLRDETFRIILTCHDVDRDVVLSPGMF